MTQALRWTIVTVAAALSANIAAAQTTSRVSVDSNGAQVNAASLDASISADGRYVAFMSYATNLVSGDTNGERDVFVRDRQLGTTERVSIGAASTQGNSNLSYPWVAISGDGRFVGFSSDASNLVQADTNNTGDVFVRDRLTATTERVSVSSLGVQGINESMRPALSADGRFVAFEGSSANLVAGDTNGIADIFVRDRQSGSTTRVSVDSSGAEGAFTSYGAALSADGRFVAFNTRSSLVPGDTQPNYDVYIHDLQTGVTEWVSVALGGAQSDDGSYFPSLSGDGRYVAFHSVATNLIAGDTNSSQDVFLRDRQLQATTRLSISTAGTQQTLNSDKASISIDGRYVAFRSDAAGLVAGDTNGWGDIFLRDRGLPPPASFCFGDGSGVACPCGNSGTAGRGCQNSATTGGALLTAAGQSSLANDTLSLTSNGELPSVTSIFLQGDVAITGVSFGDGVRCAGGVLKRLYVHNALAGVVSAPIEGDLSIHARSAALGDPLSAGAPRYYQTYYRDPAPAFCASPSGNTWNISSGVTVVWS